VKRTITGNGHAGKPQVQRSVAMLCKLSKPPEPPDVADAIAIAWTMATRMGREAP
jgi:crossover junction endodeoxyribonuclease RuvC